MVPRYAWVAGIVFVVALLAEVVVAVGIPINQDDSAVKIATALRDHDQRELVIAALSIVYAVAFVIWLCLLYDLLRPDAAPALASLVLVGGVLLVALHAVSDIAITGLLGAKIASFGASEDLGLSYSLYLLTFALDSVGDVFGSLFLSAAGILVLRSGALPRWLGWVAIAAGALLFVQGFGLGGVISVLGLVLDLVGFVVFLVFVLASSLVKLLAGRRTRPAPPA
jgi:hypothetical protein